MMQRRLLVALGLFGLAAAVMPGRPAAMMWSTGSAAWVAPAEAAGTPARPTSISYDFQRGRVHYPRNVSLGLDIQTEDPFTPSNNGEYKVGFQAKMYQYVTQATSQVAQIATVFQGATTLVNNVPVDNAIPPTYDPKLKAPNEYVIFVGNTGICDCSRLPALIYSVRGNVPHHVYLGDFFYFLHPYLPQSPATIKGGSWVARYPFALTPKHQEVLPMLSRLVLQNGQWMVDSSLSRRMSLTLPAKEWQTQWGSNWPALPYNSPVSVTATVSMTSTLTLGQSDGIDTVPQNATAKTPTTFCGACTGYTMPLDGVETIDLYYTQNGKMLLKSHEKAHLTIGISASS